MAKNKPKRQPPPPSCKAILLCERVILDHFEASYSVIGIIDGFLTLGFPYRVDPKRLFLQLTDGIGEFRLSVQIFDIADDVILARKDDQSITLHDKLEKQVFVLDVPPFELPREGRYELLVLADGQLIDRQSFYAHLYREEQHGEETFGEPDE